jgi:ATP-dependent DNA helicase RecG
MRPEILFPLFAPAATLKGVGPKIEPLVQRVAGPLVRDLLFLSPSGLIERHRSLVQDAQAGEVQTFAVRIDAHLPPRRADLPYRIRTVDETGIIFLNWFKGYGPHLQRQHPVGAERAASGKVSIFNVERAIVHPDYVVPLGRIDDIPRRETVYPTTAGLSPRTVRKLVLEALAQAPDLMEWQDDAWLSRQNWMGWVEAMRRLHDPLLEADLSPAAPHRRRLAYDELLAHQLAMAQRKSATQTEVAAPVKGRGLATRLERALPFALTEAQVRSLGEIRADLQAGRRMSRIVQGDVGSGKTVLAMLAMADVAEAGRQSALMAPTEILARQHFETIAAPLGRVGVKTVLLTGRDKGGPRMEKLAAIASGAAQVVVGTHALFQDDVDFQHLCLAVIDEQHRFGVSERRRLQAKGEAVHMLALSATPIPRTLELTLYGDLDVSRLDEKPPGRKPVTTTAAPSGRVEQVKARLRAAVAGGAQAFWICPLVAETDLIDVTAAEARAADLRESLGDAAVGLIHGKLKSADKDAVMGAFAEGRVGVLVATTVVEVGVNVPNASIMVIEHAERFGLSQLHQLRGRVGRGAAQSACLLLYDPPLTKAAQARIEILRETEDGFLIAEKDLELRGGGDLMGLKQSGFPAYRFADPAAHRDLLLAAADDARLVLARDPHLVSARGQALRVLQALFDWNAEEGWAAAG